MPRTLFAHVLKMLFLLFVLVMFDIQVGAEAISGRGMSLEVVVIGGNVIVFLMSKNVCKSLYRWRRTLPALERREVARRLGQFAFLLLCTGSFVVDFVHSAMNASSDGNGFPVVEVTLSTLGLCVLWGLFCHEAKPGQV